jgi:hypothetical protein
VHDVGVDGPDAGTTEAVEDDEIFAGEALECFTHGRLAYVQLTRELGFDQRLPWEQLEREDCAPNRGIGAIGKRRSR